MNAKHFLWIVLPLLFSASLHAQLTDSFEVISARTSLPSPIQNNASDKALSQNPEVLITQRRYKEAASYYSRQISDNHLTVDSKKLEAGCYGLFRVLSLSNKLDDYPDAFNECQPSTIDLLFGKVDRPPMFLTNPEFSPPTSWLNTAEPGVFYTVQVNFDIDEKGKAKNFSFPMSEGYYLQFPVISALRDVRYLPAIKNQKPVKTSNNFIQVVFCLERGEQCKSLR